MIKVCLIPARSGSKRIKNKNIKSFFGKPLISYSIQKAIKSKLFNQVIVSTNSLKIAKIAKKFGASVPFLRPKKLSNDFASDKDVLNHYLEYTKSKKMQVGILCYLYPTAPLTKISTLKKCYNLLVKSGYPIVMTVCKFSYPVERALKKNKYGEIVWRVKKYMKYRSQNLSESFHDANQCYWYNINKYKKYKNRKFIKTLGVELKRYEVQDINTIDDFKVAKRLYKLNRH